MSKSVSVNYSFAGGLGAPLAAVLSYVKWHSFWLALGHFFLGWFYVLYHIFTYGIPHIRSY